MSEKLFKTGEFAALCGVPKDTIFHYDHIGILTPTKVDESSGYRYYSVRQLRTFDMIAALKRLGMSLAEIKDYLDRRNPQAFLSLLLQQQESLARERRQLNQLEELITGSISATELALTAPIGQIHLEQMGQAHYVAIAAQDYAHFDEPQYLLRVRELFQRVREQDSLNFSPGDIIRKEKLEKEIFLEDYHFSWVSPDADIENIQCKPAGTYAVLYHQGGYDTLETACETLCRWVWANGYEIVGHLYEEDLLHNLSCADATSYIFKIYVQVARIPSTEAGT